MFPEESLIWSVYKEKRYLPIHYACMLKAPVDVVSELAEMHPFGLELTCQDENRSALHLACHYGAHFSVIRVLLDIHMDAASYRDDLGLLPLHLACGAACHHDDANKAVGSSSPTNVWNGNAVIRAILQAYPKGASIPDAQGNTPAIHVDETVYRHSKSLANLLTAKVVVVE